MWAGCQRAGRGALAPRGDARRSAARAPPTLATDPVLPAWPQTAADGLRLASALLSREGGQTWVGP
jgi:hypothetical protein